MKKIILLFAALTTIATVSAQRVAVLDFNAGAGVSQADVDGISSIFNTYFSPDGYTLVECTSIDRVIDEQNFQRGKMTQSQMVRVGEILNVSKVVIGDVNIVMGQYNIDVRVVNVESGTISAKDGVTWSPGSSYRTMMSGLASRLANQIAINPTTQSTSYASETYEIGDIITVNGKKGVVFAVSSDGKHGRVVSLEEFFGSVRDTVVWADSYCQGWRLANAEDLQRLYKVIRKVNDAIFLADGETIPYSFHWYYNGSTYVVDMSSGSVVACYEEMNFARAVSAF